MNDFLTIYITGGAMALFVYGLLIGVDKARPETFESMAHTVVFWPLMVIAILGVLLGSGLKKLWSAKK